MDRLKGRVAVITGIASGIGLATAEHFAAEGACIAGIDLGRPAEDAWARIGDSSPGKFVVEPVVPIAKSRHRKEGMRLWENLKYKSKTDTAKFRVLLYAYRDGDPLPEVVGKDGDYTIKIGEQTHLLKIIERAGEISRLSIK